MPSQERIQKASEFLDETANSIAKKAEDFKAEHGEEVRAALITITEKTEDLIVGASSYIKDTLFKPNKSSTKDN